MMVAERPGTTGEELVDALSRCCPNTGGRLMGKATICVPINFSVLQLVYHQRPWASLLWALEITKVSCSVTGHLVEQQVSSK